LAWGRAAGGVPRTPPLARDRLRPAPARQPGVEWRHPADPGNAGQVRRRRRAGRARLRAARQPLAQRHRRPRARIPARTARTLPALPLRRRCRRPGAGWPRASRRHAGRGGGAGRTGRGAGAGAVNAVLHAPPMPLDRLGRPLHDLRLSVIEACNFRCGYCMPADRVPDDYGMDAATRLSFDEIETLVRGLARLGVRKLRLTGGEPLLRKRLTELVARLAAIDGIDDLALTTNGALLAGQARALREAGLRRITISLD